MPSCSTEKIDDTFKMIFTKKFNINSQPWFASTHDSLNYNIETSVLYILAV